MNATHLAKDQFLFLESLKSAKAKQWVSAQNTRTLDKLGQDPAIATLTQRLVESYESPDRIVSCSRHGDWAYNTWTDAEHPLGLVRRTAWQDWLDGKAQWDTVLDVDALPINQESADGTRWALADFDLRYPDGERALVSLSPDGSDACVIHEFDMVSRCFVDAGFTLPEPGQHSMAWIDRDTVYVAWDDSAENDEAALTDAGHPRQLRRWRRGTSLLSAPVVLECASTDIVAHAWFDHEQQRHLATRYLSMWRTDWLWFDEAASQWRRYAVPGDADLSEWQDWLFITLRSDWRTDAENYAAGSLLAVRRDDFLAGLARPDVLFIPATRRVLADLDFTLHYLILTEREECVTKLRRLQPPASREASWTSQEIAIPSESAVTMEAVDGMRDDTVLIHVDHFLEPTALYYADLSRNGGGKDDWRLLARQAPQFDTRGMSAQLRHANAPDGTRIPYWLIGRLSDTPQPCLLYGYGGFEESLDEPAYIATTGISWLERGGLYAIACIRGGGEFGPAWHQAALRENRQIAFDDFIAVAETLVATGVTRPEQLGISGASNGGLLVAACMVQKPELFGAVLCSVPVLDMARFHKLLQGATWVEEYGNPDDAQALKWLLAYSPYHQVQADVAYPDVLFTTSSSDDRVHPGHARKMAAKMQALGHENVCYLERRDGGHGAGVDARAIAYAEAIEASFLWRALTEEPAA
ncbi:prolyl oligopeptidase family serine peptidase [Bordetella avium]|uniref:prolyl oligopeptidase family serine peptidase n=1 Tax=Bordetella avium TaxID=521 RepID=UPI000E67B790|nr:prolyl oligopeptidase family serine peptidase [Bordetella avium]RIQ20105.1 S9 family peptidase [Bordetella avium]RIQ34696.1 S9 family peptidase [Bordetella avium]RIQ69881.1 S9 family peptidase [Bordetella avium]